MNHNDLDELHLWSAAPAEHRLRACMEARLSGPDYDQNCAQLAVELGYTRPEVVRMWLNFRTKVPLDKLAGISRFIGVHLGVLLAFWIAEYAGEGQEEELFNAASPRITDDEYELIETARAIYHEEASEQAGP